MKKFFLLTLCLLPLFLFSQETIRCYIENGDDDAYQMFCNTTGHPPTGEMFVHSDGLFMGYTANPTRYYSTGLRYESVPVPREATIVSAYIQFTALSGNDQQHNVTVCIENSVDPQPFTDEDYNITNRTAYPYYVTWSIADWYALDMGLHQKTHNIASLVQSFIDRDVWVKDSPMVFFFDGEYPSFGETYPKEACSWDYGAGYDPYLEITFYPPASVEEYSMAKTVHIYPNPVQDRFTVWYLGLQQGEYEIQLLDLQGKLVNDIFRGSHGEGDLELVLSASNMGLTQGLYILRLQGETGQINKKIIVR